MKVAVIGGVKSTRVLVEKLYLHGYRDVCVWGYSPSDSSLVSGWCDLTDLSRQFGFSYKPFVKIADCTDALIAYKPDYIFAVGLSQIIPEPILALPSRGCIGFHPTALPKGRGRAAIAWLVLEQVSGAASFFLLREGVDDGPLVGQVPFVVTASDDAASVEDKLLEAEAKALDEFLPALLAENYSVVEQDQLSATWYGRRTPDDGLIDWSKSSFDLDRLIRASSKPHPGAYTFHDQTRLTIWSAVIDDRPERGVSGRILQCYDDGSFIVQTGAGLIRVRSWEADAPWAPRIGQLLGYYSDLEINQLKRNFADLERRLAFLESNKVSGS